MRIANLIQWKAAQPTSLLFKKVWNVTEELEAAGGFNYLITLAQNTPSRPANIRRYAEIVRERSIMRQLAEVGTEIARNAYNPQGA